MGVKLTGLGDRLDGELGEQVRQFQTRRTVSTFTLLLGCLLTSLRTWTGSSISEWLPGSSLQTNLLCGNKVKGMPFLLEKSMKLINQKKKY